MQTKYEENQQQQDLKHGNDDEISCNERRRITESLTFVDTPTLEHEPTTNNERIELNTEHHQKQQKHEKHQIQNTVTKSSSPLADVDHDSLRTQAKVEDELYFSIQSEIERVTSATSRSNEINNSTKKVILNQNEDDLDYIDPRLTNDKKYKSENNNNLHNKKIIVETDSWRTVQLLTNCGSGSNNIPSPSRILCDLKNTEVVIPTISDFDNQHSNTNLKINKSKSINSDIIVIREQTTSSSSDSIFTDPLTPLGFATEINQCYMSEENILDNQDNDQKTSKLIASRNNTRRSNSSINSSGHNNIKTKLDKLTISKISLFEFCEIDDDLQDSAEIIESNICDKSVGVSDHEDHDNNDDTRKMIIELNCDNNINDIECENNNNNNNNSDNMPLGFRNKINPIRTNEFRSLKEKISIKSPTTPVAVNNLENADADKEKGIFNISRIKKVELPDISNKIERKCV